MPATPLDVVGTLNPGWLQEPETLVFDLNGARGCSHSRDWFACLPVAPLVLGQSKSGKETQLFATVVQEGVGS